MLGSNYSLLYTERVERQLRCVTARVNGNKRSKITLRLSTAERYETGSFYRTVNGCRSYSYGTVVYYIVYIACPGFAK